MLLKKTSKLESFHVANWKYIPMENRRAIYLPQFLEKACSGMSDAVKCFFLHSDRH